MLLRRIGREGQGPGEFLSLYSLAWVGDTLLALDFGNGRIGELSPQGEWLGTRPAPGRVSGPASMLRLYAVSDTQVYQWSIKQVDGQVRRTWVEQGIGGVGEEWVQQTPTPPEPTTVVCDRPDGAISFFDVPFGGKMLEHPAGAGDTWVAWSPDYQLALVAPDGDTLRLVERAWDPLPILDAEWDSATVEFDDFREEWPDAGCRPSAPPRPKMKTALRNLLVDTEGRLWVEVYTKTDRVGGVRSLGRPAGSGRGIPVRRARRTFDPTRARGPGCRETRWACSVPTRRGCGSPGESGLGRGNTGADRHPGDQPAHVSGPAFRSARGARPQAPRVVAGVAVTVQAAHFLEELRTGFPQAFPSILGLRPWSTAAFVLFNVAWLCVWCLALLEAPRGHRLAEWPLWFLGLAMTVNGVAHPLLAVGAGGYFPGLWTSIPSAIVGVVLLRELTRVSRVRAAQAS